MLHSSLKRSIGFAIALGSALSPLGLAQNAAAKAIDKVIEEVASGDVDPALAQLDAFLQTASIDKSAADWKSTLPKPPQLNFTPGIDYFWELETSKGPVKLLLFTKEAPMHASTTMYLSRVGFYDDLNFHRVITGFMAQSGSTAGDGTGGPGFQIDGEVDPSMKHDRAGVLSAANRGKGTPESSQFFITFAAAPHLDGVHTIYGQAVEGLDTLKKLDAIGSRQGAPEELVQLVGSSISVAENIPVVVAESHDSDDPAISAVRAFIAESAIEKELPRWKEKLPKPPQATFTEGKSYMWNILTNKGLIRLKLMPEVAPMHATSTLYLAMNGFYDGLNFHRVIKGFMAQGGCPRGDGRGEPGYNMNLETDPKVKHDRRGLLSAANYGRDGTDGSQFYITFAPAPHLDGGYTIYGAVVEGMDVVDSLEKASGGSRLGSPTEPLEIVRTTISIE